MVKIDKSLYTKEEWHKIREQRRATKKSQEIQELKNNQPKPLLKANRGRSKTAFVLGNGLSRKGIDLETLKQYGPIYGCNAIYREFDPDYLISVDVKMVLELNKAKYQMRNPNCWTNKNKAIEQLTGFNIFNPSKGWSSGPTALWLASQHQYEKIYILGFDYRGLQDGKQFNNVYADTPNYKKSTDGATFFGNWLRQTKSVIQGNRQIDYVRVITSDNYCPEELNNFGNFKNINKEDFVKIFDV